MNFAKNVPYIICFQQAGILGIACNFRILPVVSNDYSAASYDERGLSFHAKFHQFVVFEKTDFFTFQT